MTKALYQLVAQGVRKYLDAPGTIYSRKVFMSRGAAERYIMEYRALVCIDQSGYDMAVLDPDERLEISIVELELVDAV